MYERQFCLEQKPHISFGFADGIKSCNQPSMLLRTKKKNNRCIGKTALENEIANGFHVDLHEKTRNKSLWNRK